MLADLLTVAVLAFFGTRLVVAARTTARSSALRDRIVEIVRALRPRHFLRAPLVLVLVVVAAGALVQVPGLSFGWWTAMGGEGNVIFGTRHEVGPDRPPSSPDAEQGAPPASPSASSAPTTAPSPAERVHDATNAVQGVVPVLFVALLLPLLPLFAEREERMFRLGAEGWTWRRRGLRALVFGLVHLVMGIPLGVALALSIGGLYFTWAYLRGYERGGRPGGLLEATCSHLAYNLEVVAIVGLALLMGPS